MAVVLADRALTVTVRAHPWQRDSRGVPVPLPTDAQETRGPWPGAAKEQADGTWTLRVDPRAWPMRPGDKITDGVGTWVTTTARLHQLPGFSSVDYIAVTATLEPPKVP